MFNLYEILRNAQGGQAIDNLAAQFNITAEEADAAVKAIVPALSEGFLKQTQHPLGIGSFIGALGEGQHLAAFTDPAAAQDLATAQKGGDILSQVLGSDSAREEIALRASSATGISPDISDQNAPGDRFDDLRRPYEVHAKSRIWWDPRATRQCRGAGRPWPYSGPDSGRRFGSGQFAAAAVSRARPSRMAGEPRLYPWPDLRRRPESNGAFAAAGVRACPSGRAGRPRRPIGVYFGKSCQPAGGWPSGGIRRPQRKSASARFRCSDHPGGSRGPHQDAAARNTAAREPGAKRDSDRNQ